MRAIVLVLLLALTMVALPGAAGAQTNEGLLEEPRALREEMRDQESARYWDNYERDKRERQEQKFREEQRKFKTGGFDCYRLGPNYVVGDPD